MKNLKTNLYRQIRRVALGGCIFLSGCIVLPDTYYEPLTEGETSPRGCGGGPNNVLTAPIADEVSVTLYVSNGPLVWVSAQFNVPESKTLRLLTPSLKVLNREGSVIDELSISYLTDSIRDQYGYRQVRRRTGDLLQGGTEVWETPLWSREAFRRYDAALDRTENLPDYIQIQLPDMEINGKRIKSEPIRFELTTWIFIYSFNC